MMSWCSIKGTSPIYKGELITMDKTNEKINLLIADGTPSSAVY